MKIAEQLKYIVACYWRFTRGHTIISLEHNYGDSDILSMTKKQGVVCETEIKISMSDLKKELSKPKHFGDVFGVRRFNSRFINFFYIAVPSKLLDRAKPFCDEMLPYAGILEVKPFDDWLSDYRNIYLPPPVESIKEPSRVTSLELKDADFEAILRGMSNSLCNIAFRLMKTEKTLS